MWRHFRRIGPYVGLFFLWMISVSFSLWWGTVPISWSEIGSLLLNPTGACSSSDALFVLCTIRIPRVLFSGLCGYVLALSGTVMQGLFRTPMADPYLLGMLGGSSVGVSLLLLLGVGGSVYLLPIGAFVGGLLAIVIVIMTSRVRGGQRTTYSLLLSGVACSAICSAATTCFLFFSSPRVDMQRFMFWLLGSFSRSQSSHVLVLTIAILVVSPLLFLGAKRLNILRLGDVASSHLGVSPTPFRVGFLVLTTVLTACVVAFVGPIGFVGLFVPHLARWLVGPDHRRLLPASALLGAVILTWCDTLARMVFAPSVELPVGVVTAVLGAPSIWILIQTQRKDVHVSHPHD